MSATVLQPAVNTGHRVPADVDGPRFRADQDRFLELLEAQGLDVHLYAAAFNPYPFVVTAERLAELRALQRSIHRAIVAVVTHFGREARLSAVIRLPAAERELLARIADLPYRVGAFRPDFLHAADGSARVTEINARFPLNGFLSSAILNRCVPLFNPGLVPLLPLAGLEAALRSRLGESGTVGILKSSEPGWDVNLVRALWGRRCEMVAPGALTGRHLARWRSVLLELHQHELIGEVPALLQPVLAGHPGVLNDLRTILIAHDKRLLALLSTADVLDDYLKADDLARLRRHVVPTWVKGLAPEKVREARECPAGWLAKPPRSGKGKGIVVSSQLTPARWRETLDELPDDWVLQPYVEQQTFPVTTLRHGDLETTPMRVVGVLPALDDYAFGPGLYRAAADEVVNVARGGIILAPAMIGGTSCPH
jgi:hypothetical protein